jgi:hypothetical protein
LYYDSGEKPGKGTYQCIYSGHQVYLSTDDDKLPRCPNHDCTCKHSDTKWVQIS